MEIPFKFDHPEFNPMGGATSMTGTTPGRLQTALNMSGAWAAFARTGDPNFDGIPHCLRYTLEMREIMFINAQCQVVSDPWREGRLLWVHLLWTAEWISLQNACTSGIPSGALGSCVAQEEEALLPRERNCWR